MKATIIRLHATHSATANLSLWSSSLDTHVYVCSPSLSVFTFNYISIPTPLYYFFTQLLIVNVYFHNQPCNSSLFILIFHKSNCYVVDIFFSQLHVLFRILVTNSTEQALCNSQRSAQSCIRTSPRHHLLTFISLKTSCSKEFLPPFSIGRDYFNM